MHKDVRFPKQERLARGRNNYFETSGVRLEEGPLGCLDIYAWTARYGGNPSEAARIVLPFTHLREFIDAANAMLAHIEPDALLAEDDDDDDEPSQFRNFYRCKACKHEWEDVWSAQCDDDCPSCGARHMSPYKSEDM